VSVIEEHPPAALDAAAEPAERVARATLAGIARFGVSKLTVDDIAREAGCSRATIYRAFSSKRALVDAAVGAAADDLTARLVDVGTTAPTFVDAVTDVIVVGARELNANDALRFVAEYESEVLHPHVSFAGGDRFLAAAAARLAPAFAPWTDDPLRVAEWTVRVGLCLVWFPHPPVDVRDRDAVRSYVAAFVVRGLTAAAATTREVH
jgi:AcrR family transcriptional regulator